MHQPKSKHYMNKGYTSVETGSDNVAESSGRYSSFMKGKRVSKTWEAAQRLKGSIIVYDPTLYED